MIAKSAISWIQEKQAKALGDRPPGHPRELLGRIPYLSDRALLLGGVRGSGRSTLLGQLMRSEYPQAWYLDFEDPRLAGFDASDFPKSASLVSDSGCGVVLLDKVDRIVGWISFVNDLLDAGIKVVATVSLDTLLNVEAAQYRMRTGAAGVAPPRRQGMPGPKPRKDPPPPDAETVLMESSSERYITLRVPLFSYREFLDATQKRRSEQAVQEYLLRGAFPEQQRNARVEQLFTLYETILGRDVLLLRGIRDQITLRRVALRLLGSPGGAVTANALRKELKIKAVSTVSEHLENLERAGLVNFVPFWSPNPASTHLNPRKVYPVDTALTAALSLQKNPDREKGFKVMIYRHLAARYGTVAYTAEEGGCDFVLLEDSKPVLCVQACFAGDNPDELQQSAEGLARALELTGATRGIIVTLGTTDRIVYGSYELEVVDADSFLSE